MDAEGMALLHCSTMNGCFVVLALSLHKNAYHLHLCCSLFKLRPLFLLQFSGQQSVRIGWPQISTSTDRDPLIPCMLHKSRREIVTGRRSATITGRRCGCWNATKAGMLKCWGMLILDTGYWGPLFYCWIANQAHSSHCCNLPFVGAGSNNSSFTGCFPFFTLKK